MSGSPPPRREIKAGEVRNPIGKKKGGIGRMRRRALWLVSAVLVSAHGHLFRPAAASADIPPSCQPMIEATGKATVQYLADVGAGLRDAACQEQCLSSICAPRRRRHSGGAGASSGALLKPGDGCAPRRAEASCATARPCLAPVFWKLADVPDTGPVPDCRNKPAHSVFRLQVLDVRWLTCVCSKRCVQL